MAMSTTDLTRELTLEDVIRARHSVRSYDPSFVISREELKEIITLTTRAPSSSNLQHWRFLIIDTPEMKEKLLPIANNQQQVVEASAVIGILGDLKGYRKSEKIYRQAVQAGYMTEELGQSFASRTASMYSALPPEKIREVAVIDATLAAMQLMLVAQSKGYGTVPMGGFNRDRFKEEFGLGEQYVPVMLIPIGKPAKAGHPTARLPVEDVIFWNEVSEKQK